MRYITIQKSYIKVMSLRTQECERGSDFSPLRQVADSRDFFSSDRAKISLCNRLQKFIQKAADFMDYSVEKKTQKGLGFSGGGKNSPGLSGAFGYNTRHCLPYS